MLIFFNVSKNYITMVVFFIHRCTATLSIMTFSITTFNIMTLSITEHYYAWYRLLFSVLLSVMRYAAGCYAECHNNEWHDPHGNIICVVWLVSYSFLVRKLSPGPLRHYESKSIACLGQSEVKWLNSSTSLLLFYWEFFKILPLSASNIQELHS